MALIVPLVSSSSFSDFKMLVALAMTHLPLSNSIFFCFVRLFWDFGSNSLDLVKSKLLLIASKRKHQSMQKICWQIFLFYVTWWRYIIRTYSLSPGSFPEFMTCLMWSHLCPLLRECFKIVPTCVVFTTIKQRGHFEVIRGYTWWTILVKISLKYKS